MILVFGKEVEGRPRRMVRGVVEHQDRPPSALGPQETAEEFVEPSGVLPPMHEVVDLPALVVDRPVETALLVRPGRRDLGASPPEGPDLGQGRVEVNLTLVEEEEIEAALGIERAFFRKSRISFFSSYSCGSRRCPMTCRGRR